MLKLDARINTLPLGKKILDFHPDFDESCLDKVWIISIIKKEL